MNNEFDDIPLKDLIDAIEDCDFHLSNLDYLIKFGGYDKETNEKLNDTFNRLDRLERQMCSSRDNRKILERKPNAKNRIG